MKIITILFIVGILVACSAKNESIPNENTIAQENGKSAEPIFPYFNFDTLVGSYEGDFAGSPIRININFASNKHATGYNIHKGLVRNISGKVTEDSNSVFLTLAEPGENEFDGVFYLTVNRDDLKMSGTWTPNDENLTEKSFELKRILENDNWEKMSRAEILSYQVSGFGDTIGDFIVLNDGLIRYDFYPEKDDIGHKEQMETVRGNWSIENDSTVSVTWEKNNVFSERKSNFQIMKDPEDLDYGIIIFFNGRRLYPEMY